MGQRAYLKVYTRTTEKNYPDGLANSIHMAFSLDGKEFHPFFKNYGILYAKAEILSDDTLLPKGLAKPFLFAAEDTGFYIMAVQTCETGISMCRQKGSNYAGIRKIFFTLKRGGLHKAALPCRKR